MRVLVMGGTLFNGLALVRELVRTGHEVTVLNRGRTAADLPRGVRRLVGDRTDHDRMRELLAGEEFDCVQDMSAYHPEDVALMIELLSGRTGHYVFASSTVVYAPTELLPITEDHPVDRGPNQNEYGLHKLLCEDLLVRAHREQGFPATIVAFSMVFGPHNAIPDREQRMFARLLAGRPVLVPGDGTTVGQVGHVDDQARALRMVMGRPVTFGRRYNLTGGQCHTDLGYVQAFAEATGIEPEVVHVPHEVMDAAWDGRLGLEVGETTTSAIEIRQSADARRRAEATRLRYRLATLIQRVAPNLHRWNRSVVFSTDRLRRDVGWEPEYTFPGMVAHTWEWFQREGLGGRLRFDFGLEDQLLSHLGR